MHVSEQARRQHRKYRRIVDGGDGGTTSSTKEQQQQQQQQQQEEQEEQQEQPQRASAGEQLRPSKRSRHDRSSCAATNRHHHQQQQQQQQAAEGDTACLYDTVGCVVLAAGGTVAAGVSSGGIVLKTEGRVGEAALYGAGCWAQQAQPGPGQQPLPAVACSVTGVGEHVMRHLLARECCLAAATAAEAQPAVQQHDSGVPGSGLDVPLDQLAAHLLQRTILRGPPPHDCGLLCLQAHPVDGSRAGGGSQPACNGGGTTLPSTTHTPCVLPQARPSADAAGSGLAASASQQQEQPKGQASQQRQQQRYAVEVAVAHTAQSMAFAHMSCTLAGSAACIGSRKAAPPAVFVLRRQASHGGDPAELVQSYVHGVTVML
jgi:taspase (threonine aspartase 1)